MVPSSLILSIIFVKNVRKRFLPFSAKAVNKIYVLLATSRFTIKARELSIPEILSPTVFA